MPTYEFKNESDGSISPVDAPDRATAIQLFKSGGVAPKAQEGVISRSNPAEFKPVDTQPAGVISRAGSGMYDPVVGSQQLYAHTFGDPEMQIGVDKYVNERERELRATGAGEGDWARAAGRMVPGALIGTAVAGPVGGGVTAAAVGGGLDELLNPVVTDVNAKGESNYKEQKIKKTLVGMGTGGAGGAVVKGIGKALAPQLSVDAQKLVDAGVELTPARMVNVGLTGRDVGGTIARKTEDAFRSVPVTGSFIADATKRSIGTYNLATINQALEHIGVKLPDTVKAGHEAIDFMTKAGSKAYDDILKSNPQLKIPPTIWPKLENDINNAAFLARSLPPNSTGLQFQQILQDRVMRVLDPLSQGQSLPAPLLKQVDADLRHFITAYSGAADPAYRQMADHLKDVRVAVRNAFATAHPQEAQALKRADAAWSEITKIQQAANGATNEGYFMPSHLLSAIRNQDPSIRHHYFAAGTTTPRMLDFAETAHRLLPSKMADSGTGERLAHMSGAGALAFLSPKVLAGLAGTSLPYTTPGMTLAQMIANPGPKQAATAKAFKAAAPYVGTTAEPLVKNALPRARDEKIPTLDYHATSSQKGEPGVAPAYEKGGRPAPNSPAVVGDGDEPRPELWVSDSGKVKPVGLNGPEVIVPNEPGTIIPNEQIRKPTYQDYLMNAIRSLTQRMDPTRLVQPPGPQTGSIPQDLAGSIPLSTLALRPSAVRLTPTNTASPRLQVRGRFASHTDDPRWAHPGVMNSPLVGGAMATNLIPEDSAPAVERPAAPAIAEDSAPTIERPAPVVERAPTSVEGGDLGKMRALPSEGTAGGGGKSRQAPRQQPRRAQPQAVSPGLLDQVAALLRSSPELTRLVQPPRRGQAANGHYAEGGRPPLGQPAVVGDQPNTLGIDPANPMAGITGLFTGGQMPGIAKAFMGQNPLEGVDTSNQGNVLASLFGGMPGLASAFTGNMPQGSPSLDSLTGGFGRAMAPGSFHHDVPENPALQQDDDEENRRHRFGGSMPGYAEGGRPEVGEPATVGETEVPEVTPAMTYPTEAPAGEFSRPPLPESPFERAALRQRGGRPTPEPAYRATPAEMAEALAAVVAPGPARLITSAPKLATAALAGYYGLSGTDETNAAETPNEIMARQAKLRAAGYDVKVDGKDGESTRKAQADFEAKQAAELKKQKDEELRLQGETTAAATKREDTQNKLADAQLKKLENDEKERLAKDTKRKEGNQRLREVESNLPADRKFIRDYGTPLGYTLGLVGGKALQAGIAKAYNKVMGNKAAAAEKIFENEAADNLGRVAKVNEFYRQGGAGAKVPFLTTPGADPGFAVNPKAVGADKLFAKPSKMNAAKDVAATGVLEGEGLGADFLMVQPAQEELRLANEAFTADPSEGNIARLQEAKAALAKAEILQNFGRAGGASYAGGALLKGRTHVQPNMATAGEQKLFLEKVLRESQATKEKAAKVKATKAKKAEAAAEVPEGRTLNIVPAGIPPAFTGSAAAQARRVNLR